MKKTFILLALISILLIISSCTEKMPSEKDSDVKAPISEDEKVTPDAPPEVIEYSYSVTARDFDSIYALTDEERAHEFVSALCLNDTEIVNYYIGGSINSFDSVKMNAYIKSFENSVGTVILTVEESDSTAFTVGEHEYIIEMDDITNTQYSYVTFFGTADDYAEYLKGASLPISDDDLFNDGYIFSSRAIDLGYCDTLDIHHMIRHTHPKTWDYYSVDVENYSKYLSDRFGIDGINVLDIKELSNYIITENGEKKIDIGCAHGGTVMPHTFEKFEQDGIKYSYTFVFYSDFAYISPTQKVTYTFEKRDGCDILTFTGITTEKLGDGKVARVSF